MSFALYVSKKRAARVGLSARREASGLLFFFFADLRLAIVLDADALHEIELRLEIVDVALLPTRVSTQNSSRET